jgi:hypothetical protein
MAAEDFRFQRHYALWTEQNRQVSRWAFGTVLFAAVVLWKVLLPYVDFSEQATARQGELASLRVELAAIAQKQAPLTQLGDRLTAVRAAIDRKPWMAEKERLVDALRQLDWAYRTLSSASPAALADALRQSDHPPLAPVVQQQPLPTHEAHPLVRAAAMLGLESEPPAATVAVAAFQRLLDEHLQRRVQEEADGKVHRIVQHVHHDILQPLKQLLDQDVGPGREFEAVRGELVRIQADMGLWAREHIGNATWYQSIQQKDRELNELTDWLRRRQEEFLALVQQQQRALEQQQHRLKAAQQEKQAQVAALEEQLHDLAAAMQRVLPDWVRDVVSPPDMLQLYPFVLLVLVGIIGVKLGMIRRHYLVVRDHLGGPASLSRDAALSSLWTLVDRGAFGMAATGLVLCGGTLLLWWLFERGYELTAAWLLRHPTAAWTPPGSWLTVLRWLGRLFFAAIFLAVPAALLHDRRRGSPLAAWLRYPERHGASRMEPDAP